MRRIVDGGRRAAPIPDRDAGRMTLNREYERPGSAPPTSSSADRWCCAAASVADEPSTTDQRLLDSRGPSDWVHTDPWRVLRIQAEFVEGFGALAELPRAVTVFGSARTSRDHPEYATGGRSARRWPAPGYAVITGGGPGAMEAANRGAREAGGFSVGLGIELPFEQGLNEWVDLGINFRYFFARKTMFVKYAQAFVMPAGRFRHARRAVRGAHAGADAEGHQFPVVLLGSDYWGGLVDWIEKTVLDAGKIGEKDMELLYVTDDVDDAVRVVHDAYRAWEDAH